MELNRNKQYITVDNSLILLYTVYNKTDGTKGKVNFPVRILHSIYVNS